MRQLFSAKLKKGDEIRVIAPSRSIAILSESIKNIANGRFAKLGLKLSFGAHVNEKDEFVSSSIESRVADLHDAFRDPAVKGIITVIGGFNCNQLFRYIDWELLRNNPKVFCGYSDITALNNAIFAKTGLVTYSGPHYSTFGQKLHFEYTVEYFQKCLMNEQDFEIKPSSDWTDDSWYMDQDDRHLVPNEGYRVINEGEAEGTILGANLCTFNLLQGTEYMPDIKDSILFLEDDYETVPHTFDRDLQSLIHLPDFFRVRGLALGRFQKKSDMTKELFMKIIKTKKELNHMPIVAELDFGHTDPKVTLPIGGTAKVTCRKGSASVTIQSH